MQNLNAQIDALLAAWPGYSALREAMQASSNVPVYLTGGAVRDIFMGRKPPPKDFDFFIGSGNYYEIIRHLEKHGLIVKGPFGSPRWFPGDGESGHADIIPIAEFYNGLWHCEDIIDALNQFDFTANAVAIDMRNGTVHDPQNGIRDISRRVMKMVRFDYPDEPIQINHSLNRLTVLWFRVLHYASILDLAIEPVTLRWLCSHIDRNGAYDEFLNHFFQPCPSYIDPLVKAGVYINDNKIP